MRFDTHSLYIMMVIGICLANYSLNFKLCTCLFFNIKIIPIIFDKPSSIPIKKHYLNKECVNINPFM